MPHLRWVSDGSAGGTSFNCSISLFRSKTGKGETVKFRHRGNDLCPDGVQVDIADEFLEVDIFLADDGFVTVLEKLTGPMVAAVEGNDVALSIE
jgi:hypothetical protein